MNDRLNTMLKSKNEKPVEIIFERKKPVLVRVDGKAFHTYTKHFAKPFDIIFREVMQDTMLKTCQEIPTCVFAYTQSDEITFVMIDYQNERSEPWLENRAQKIGTIVASYITLFFYKAFMNRFEKACQTAKENGIDIEKDVYFQRMKKAATDGAFWDAHVFQNEIDEVFDSIRARQECAYRNSVSSVGRTYFTQKQMQNKNTHDIEEMLISIGKPINSFPYEYVYGTACYKCPIEIKGEYGTAVRNKFLIDTHMPVLKRDGSNREYIDNFVKGEEIK